MELNNIFEVKAPIEEAWEKLTDLELIAPAMPGAQLEEVEGDEYRGTVKVKVGPITAKYKGTAKIVEKDDDAKKAVIDAKGRDTRGQGNANALITAQLTSAGDDVTKVELLTDLTLTGKVAQFARGVLTDVSTKLIGQFVENLESDVIGDGAGASNSGSGSSGIDANTSATTDAAAEVTSKKEESDAKAQPDDASDSSKSGSEAADKPAAQASSEAKPESGDASPTEKTPAATPAKAADESKPSNPAAKPAASPGPRKINSSEAEAVDLLDSAGAPVAKRVLPALGLLGIVLLIIRILRNRSTD